MTLTRFISDDDLFVFSPTELYHQTQIIEKLGLSKSTFNAEIRSQLEAVQLTRKHCVFTGTSLNNYLANAKIKALEKRKT